jgi:hypothetical protein
MNLFPEYLFARSRSVLHCAYAEYFRSKTESIIAFMHRARISWPSNRAFLCLSLVVLMSNKGQNVSCARDLTVDEFFIVTDKNSLGATSLDAPSINDQGDITLRVSRVTSTEHIVYFFKPGSRGTVPTYSHGVVVRSSPFTLSRFPIINNSRSIVSHLSFNQGNQNIYRYDYNGTTFDGTLIAQAQAVEHSPFAC